MVPKNMLITCCCKRNWLCCNRLQWFHVTPKKLKKIVVEECILLLQTTLPSHCQCTVILFNWYTCLKALCCGQWHNYEIFPAGENPEGFYPPSLHLLYTSYATWQISIWSRYKVRLSRHYIFFEQHVYTCNAIYWSR